LDTWEGVSSPKTLYDYGLSKIYELVINSHPCQAFLLETNTLLQNTLVAAHVMAHADFFANNAYFVRTRRDMVEIATVHAERIERYEFAHGKEAVEQLLGRGAGDPGARRSESDGDSRSARGGAGTAIEVAVRGSLAIGRADRRCGGRARDVASRNRLPAEPVRDLLLFIHEYSPVLEDWERDVVAIVRAEMLYFLPQIQTKVVNEGWATFWHARIVRELELTPDEYLEFARLHAGVLQPTARRLNPYALGYEILRDIERRYGTEYLFMVREMENDVSLVRNYLTEELVERLDLYLYERRVRSSWWSTRTGRRCGIGWRASWVGTRFRSSWLRRRLPRKPRTVPAARVGRAKARSGMGGKDAGARLPAVGTPRLVRDTN
jgi:stage V sporulation protein R